MSIIQFSDCKTQSDNEIFGDYDAEVTPVPIPNTVVKLCSADDTWWEAAWESRSSPELKRALTFVSVLFFIRQISSVGVLFYSAKFAFREINVLTHAKLLRS